MERPYLISTREEYEYCLTSGFNPLVDTKHFEMDIFLRVEIQRELFGLCVFGRGENIQAANERFFRWVWDHKPHVCEETMKPLHQYSAVHVSHILTRGAFPEMAHDPRNTNILTLEAHNKWEHGDQKRMRIYAKNIKMIELLKSEYSRL